jgi:membrane protein implicated in regulation of membrane protease activity
MEWIRWAWAVIALLFLIAEIFVSGFVLMCFAAGAAAAAVVAFMGYDFLWQILAFIGVSLITLLFLRPIASRLTRAGGANTVGIDRVMGKKAVVLIDIDPLLALGRVRVDREEWQAISVDGSAIPAGSIVDVVDVDGTKLRVRPSAGP